MTKCPPSSEAATPTETLLKDNTPRLAVRALIVSDDRLLLVNAWPGVQSGLWCAPGGGVQPGQSLPENLRREVMEETGLRIAVGLPCLVNEFHAPASGFHQVEIFFRCTLQGGALSPEWRDPEGVVSNRIWASRAEMEQLRFKPDGLPEAAWGNGISYDPLELLIK
ncbi:ADP-ribose pyrophosphatase YjhB, NUDIX family [Aliiruegeria lutimaris]|uniref:ADP-ribose pyrophosphatase YjhB, NUDIX family n=1 Tax=Aliiruegeria lutimaris TaxID=571298 RepID=A0A1G9I805_9RHOB|nr:ADP-ribose pyrophosphatase YjhB, NUDIX family [Aliiruegeria lutimaris]